MDSHERFRGRWRFQALRHFAWAMANQSPGLSRAENRGSANFRHRGTARSCARVLDHGHGKASEWKIVPWRRGRNEIRPVLPAEPGQGLRADRQCAVQRTREPPGVYQVEDRSSPDSSSSILTASSSSSRAICKSVVRQWSLSVRAARSRHSRARLRKRSASSPMMISEFTWVRNRSIKSEALRIIRSTVPLRSRFELATIFQHLCHTAGSQRSALKALVTSFQVAVERTS